MTDPTPTHAEDPAEGDRDTAEGDRDTADAESGVDPANRITEA